MYLLDTPLVIDLGRVRAGRADLGLIQWAADVARERLFVSAVTLVELETMATRVGRRDKAAGASLRTWVMDQVLPTFEGHVLPLDGAVARRRVTVALADTRDALFAATALEHGLTLVTREAGAFKGARVRTFDPATYRAADSDAHGDWRTVGQARPPWLRGLFSRG